MKFQGTAITSFIRGDDDALLVGLKNGAVFEVGDVVHFCLRATEESESDLVHIETTTFSEYNDVTDAGALISIPHVSTANLDLGIYYYTIWIEWSDNTVTTVIPPAKFILTPGGSHE